MARVALALVFVLVAWAGAGAETTPTETIQQVFARANSILTDPKTAERPLDRLLAVRKLVNEAFDFRSAAELASGDHWQARTAAEQEEFTWLLGDLLERAFVGQMAAKANLAGGTRVQYLIEAVDGDGARVMTAMGRKNGRDLLLGYRLVERDGAWKISDVTLDGVSLMANYRAQLDRVLGTASFPELLTQMRAMVGTGERSNPPLAGPPATVAAADAPGEGSAPPEGVAPPVAPVSIVALPLPDPAIHFATFASPAAPPVTRAAIVEPRTYTTKAYWLRIMTAGTPDEAGRLVSRLRDGKHPVGLERTTTGLTVRVGPFQDAEAAVLELLALQAKGHNPYLVAERE
jgi:phospholipid transport system substrate-binding protein